MLEPDAIKQIETIFQNQLSVVNISIQEINTKLDVRMEKMEQNLDQMGNQMQDIKQQQVKQNNEIQTLKNADRNSNLVFHGLKSTNFQEVTMEITEILRSVGIEGVKYCIRSIHKLGQGEWNNTPVLIALSSNLLKSDILKKKKILEENTTGLTIKEDLPEEIRKVRGELKQYSQKAKEKNMKVFMRKDKLVIHGKSWSLEELKNDKHENYLSNPKRTRDEEMPLEIHTSKKVGLQPGRKNSLESFLIPSNKNTVNPNCT